MPDFTFLHPGSLFASEKHAGFHFFPSGSLPPQSNKSGSMAGACGAVMLPDEIHNMSIPTL